ncbi:MAG: delta-60 repeat domain-containing protein, partial [Acidimicrobiales bacterium]
MSELDPMSDRRRVASPTQSVPARAVLGLLTLLALATALFLPAPTANSASASSTGSLDASFDSDGWNTISGSGLWFEAASVVVQSSGKVVVAGARMNGFQFDPLIARFNTDGSLDTSFGTSGTG